MGLFRDNLHWIFLLLFVVTTLALVGVGGLAAVAALGAVTSEQALRVDPTFLALEAALPYLPFLVVLGILDAVFFVGTVVAALRRVSVSRPRSDRLASFVRRFEQRHPTLASLGLSSEVEQTPEQRREQLKEQYAAGEITEAEFERGMAELLENEDKTVDQALREVERGSHAPGTGGYRGTDPGLDTGGAGRQETHAEERRRDATPGTDGTEENRWETE